VLEFFKQQAIERGFIDQDPQLDAEKVFLLVRDMPYQRASSRDPKMTIREWRGTCSGKHYLLKELFGEMGIEARIFMCTHTFTEQNCKNFPDHLREQLSDGPIPDIHTFIRTKSFNKWVDIDATWPIQAKGLGMKVNERFQPDISMEIACEPLEILEVSNGVDPQDFKEHLIQSYCGSQGKKRDRFIEELSTWLCKSLPET
jgi:hypothetical protein